ncbi:hypothetical protein LguiB_015644 [Lonicera macranthoides]
MGNGIGTLTLCFSGKTSRRRHDIVVNIPDPLDEGLGHSFYYTRPDPSSSSKKTLSNNSTSSFCTISGASISANTRTSLSTTTFDSHCNNSALDKASSFHSSNSFASLPLQPIPQNSIPSFFSAPVPQIERGFLSGPIERSFISIPLESKSNKLFNPNPKPKSNKWDLTRIFKRSISKSIPLQIQGAKVSNLSTTQSSLDDDDDDEEFVENQNLQWAQGKAGEDRIHVVISEENHWVFVGIYDGFNGPDATDYLLNTLYKNVYNEFKGLLWNDNPKPTTNSSKYSNKNDEFEDRLKNVEHSELLKALSEGLRKTEEGFLEIADMMFDENPELCLMGSCVLGMLMKGDDVYLMNVGDSRAVLAQKRATSTNDVQVFDGGDEVQGYASLDSCQLTIDHSTSVEEEVLRIKREHLDDDCAVMKDRVKGSLKVTRAFGAGFLKQVKFTF